MIDDVQNVGLDVEAGVGQALAPDIMFPLPQSDQDVPDRRKYKKQGIADGLDHAFGP